VTKRPELILPAIVLGLVLVAIGMVYALEPARSLPSFFPGHAGGSTHHHVKHALLAVILGLGCFVFAWFQGGATRSPAADV
jgi:hypothetical protein